MLYLYSARGGSSEYPKLGTPRYYTLFPRAWSCCGYPVVTTSSPVSPSKMAVTTRGLFASFRVLRPTASLFRGRLRGTLALYSNEKPDGQDSDKINQDGSVYSPDRFAWFMSRARVLPCFNIELMLLFRFPEGYNGAGLIPFDANVSEILMAPINEQEVEIKPDGNL